MEFMICFDLYPCCSTGNMLYIQLQLLFEDICKNRYEDYYTENLVENLLNKFFKQPIYGIYLRKYFFSILYIAVEYLLTRVYFQTYSLICRKILRYFILYSFLLLGVPKKLSYLQHVSEWSVHSCIKKAYT